MGGKGSGRPRESYKPLSEVFIGISSDVVNLELKIFKKLESAERKMKAARRELDKALDMYVDFNALLSKIGYHIKKHEKIEKRGR
jgi:hypothetical protein